MVANETPFKSVKDVIDYAKANPGKLNYASVGIGSSAHLATVLFSDVVGIKMQHVPYSQMSQGITDVFSGRTEVWFTTAGGSLPHVRSGKVRALAVNGPLRAKLLPELPTMIELGINMKRRVRAGTASSRRRARRRRSSTRSIAISKRSSSCPTCRRAKLPLGYRFIGGPPEQLADIPQDRDREMGRARQERLVQVELTGGYA